MSAHVISVARDVTHRFSKTVMPEIRLLEGLGVEGDAHCGEHVKHRSRVRADPTQPNLRQVHLYQSELFDEYAEKGFAVSPGDLGENIATKGVDLLELPRGTILRIGPEAEVEITGLRNPCSQIDDFLPGLLSAALIRESGQITRRTGIMGVVRSGGLVRPGDDLEVQLPQTPHQTLERV